MSTGEIRTLSDGRLLSVEKFKDIPSLRKKVKTAEIYSKYTKVPYELEIKFYEANKGEETKSVVNGVWKKLHFEGRIE